MTTNLSYRKINDTYTFFLNRAGKITQFVVKKTFNAYADLEQFVQDVLLTTTELSEDNLDRFLRMVSPTHGAQNFIEKTAESKEVSERLKFEYGRVFFDGFELSGLLINRIMDFQQKGLKEVNTLIRFLENLMENPSHRVHEQLFGFLDRGQTALTPDGHFLAYKYVNENYTSCHDNKTLHEIGTKVWMPRHMVCDDPDNGCASGLHCCTNEYLRGYVKGRKVLQVKVNPRDVVCVPKGESEKMRVCEYFVMGELTKEEVEKDILASAPVFYDDTPFKIAQSNSAGGSLRDSKGRFIKGGKAKRDSKGRFIKEVNNV